MSKYRIKLDRDRCIVCHSCEVLCKVKNETPAGISLNQIIAEPQVSEEGYPRLKIKYQPCLHCKKPECVPACPTGALYIREPDGLVLVNEDLCDGCMECHDACPWNVPRFNEHTGKMMKCDFCVDRIDSGLKPACVTACTTHALDFVLAKKKSAAKKAA